MFFARVVGFAVLGPHMLLVGRRSRRPPETPEVMPAAQRYLEATKAENKLAILREEKRRLAAEEEAATKLQRASTSKLPFAEHAQARQRRIEAAHGGDAKAGLAYQPNRAGHRVLASFPHKERSSRLLGTGPSLSTPWLVL